ncbi:MAG: ubiquinone/menaquinone biosynthesis methyltransferase [Desulfobacterales bacterium]|nr:ubiquinone/menaquinone biosynthesis methyltransferase [Desulfobacterales bacterium]
MKKLPQKASFIQNMFSEVPSTYELVNHLLTFGFDIMWRKRAAKIASMTNGHQWADMCTGTGETAVYLKQFANKKTQVYGIDFSLPMMSEAVKKQKADQIRFIASDIKALPFSDKSFDLVTISFATRNLNVTKDSLIQSFTEFYRVLKPGGHFINLETSQPAFLLFRKGFHLYLKLFVKMLGSGISGSKTAYAYLAKSMTLFYSAQELADIIKQAGFDEVTFKRLLFGTAAIHHSRKI